MKTVRSVLNELLWREDRDFLKVVVEYVHRGARGDIASVGGGDILELEPWMMVIEREGRTPGDEGAVAGSERRPAGWGGRVCNVPGQAAIPYHRILRVLYEGIVIYDRSGRKNAGDMQD